MAKAKFERTKPHVNIGTIGHVDHGKTTLSAAISKVLYDKFPELNTARDFDTIDNAPEAQQHGSTINVSRTEYEPDSRTYAHVDTRAHSGLVRIMISGAAQRRAASLGVAATGGRMAQTRERAPPAKRVGGPCL